MSTPDSAPTSPRRPATIMEVARLAGVSHQTVSRYLRHNGGLKAATFERVESAVRELNYRPNLVARSMRTRQTGRLAIVVPSSPTFTPLRMIGAAAAEAHNAGYSVETISFEGDARARTERVLELADGGQADGVLAFAPLLNWGEYAGQTKAAVVVAPAYDDHLHGLGELADGDTVRSIIEYLASIGHRRFLHLSGPQQWPSARGRREVYLNTIEQMNLTSVGVFAYSWAARAGYEAIRDLAEIDRPTAIVAANDHLAMGAIRASLERGWRVPRDVSVFGWDDEGFEYATPSLSTVQVNREAQGREAMLQLLADVRHEPAPVIPERDFNTLVIRESTGPAPRD